MNYVLMFMYSFIFSLIFFGFLYAKLNLPKRCFYQEAVATGSIGTVLSIFLLNPSGNWYRNMILAALIVILSAILVICWSFYRDPNRNYKGRENIILSPADGKIIYIRKIEKGIIPVSIKGKSGIYLHEISKTDLIKEDCWLIGINMSILDVHVNRAPMQGEIIMAKHQSGKFLSLKLPESDVQNERYIVIIKNNKFLVGVIQIASRGVRRIKSFVKQGQNVNRGQRIGKIILGSQVDIILPIGVKPLIKEGLHVYAGLTPMAECSA
jgi:phosphatidylserine decarboxylase